MNGIKTKQKELIRLPLQEIDEDKIIFYDIETDHQYAAYAKLKSIGWQQGIRGVPELVDRASRIRDFKRKLAAPDVIKVQFNGVNFDDIVLSRHDYFVHPQNRHDLFFIFKTINPGLPAFSLKFIAFYYLCDPHFPELEISNWCVKNNKSLHEAPRGMLRRYNLHDVIQTCNLFRVAWDIVIRDDFWEAYLLDLMMGEPLLEMETEGGMYLNRNAIWQGLRRLQKLVQHETQRALTITDGAVQNPNSSKQLAKYFTEHDKLELELTDSGEFSVKKSVLVALRDNNPLADCAYRIREANGSIKYFENYLNALEDETYQSSGREDWIPVQYSVDSASTLRFTSQSYYKLNFQNPNDEAKSVQVVPDGFLGWWYDATQIENVVHIYESQDDARRLSYESDENWNEYVWLCNQILGTDKTKDELDDKERSRSPQIPNWTIYKQYKTGKLALNFGMGITKFCKLFGLNRDVGEETFENIHNACPAIRSLQNRVSHDLTQSGVVRDVFQKRYSGSPSQAYKVVAYLIQGCGTGSLPKAQIRANWETLRRFDSKMPERLRHQSVKSGVICTTTHDENGGRIDLRLGDERILQLLQKLNYNMTQKFSPRFDDIPLRAKMYLSKTTAKQAIECDITDTKKILTIINGQVCPLCKGAGHIGKEKCKPCKSIGYV